jgi:hypothetical protein
LGPDAPRDYLEANLFDGFDASDGNVGLQAQDSLLAEFRFLYNAFVSRKRALFDVPGATAKCSPKKGFAYVTCSPRARINVIIGDPLVTVRGSRTYRFGPRRGGGSKWLTWEQAMRVRVRWRKCPSRVNLSRRGQSCEYRTLLRTGDSLRDAVLTRLSRRRK